MSIYEALVMLAATAVFLLSLTAGNYRGMVWIAAIAVDAGLSDAYVSSGLPYPEAVMALLDFSVCLAIWVAGVHRWELRLFILMQLSMLVSIVDLGASIMAPGWIDRETYLLMLELINYAVLILIGGVSGFVATGRATGRSWDAWPMFLSPLRPLHLKVPKGRA